MTGGQLVVARRHGTAVILELTRVAKRNALSTELMRALVRGFTEAEADRTARAVIVTGGDTVFSAGADLAEAVLTVGPEDFSAFWAVAWDMTRTIVDSPLPVIAAIEGPCITGGLELALACDFRVASETAVFGVTSTRMASIPGFGGSQRLARVIGGSRAKRMLFAGDRIDASTALEWGLVDELTPPGAVIERSAEIVESFASSSRSAVAMAKRAVNLGYEEHSRSGFEVERALSGWAAATEERAEGMRAMLEHRPPSWAARGA